MTMLAPARGPVPPPFESAYQSELEPVWKHVRRLGVAARDLEDVVHDVFVVAHRQYDTFDATLPLRPWLLGIAFRVVSAYHRRARVRGEWLAGDDAELVADPRGGPEMALATKQASEGLQAALEALPLEQRAVFVLHDIEEHSIPDIERILGVSINTLYSRLRLARQRLGQRLRRGRPAGGQP